VSGQLHAPAALPPGKRPRYSFDRRLGGPQSRSGRYGEVKIFTLSGLEFPSPLVVQPVASRYTDWAISLISILIIFSHIRERLPNGLFPSGFLTNILLEFLRISFICDYYGMCVHFYIYVSKYKYMRARGSVVGWGTMLQTRMSRVRFPVRKLDFFFNLPNLSSRIWALGSTQLLTEMSARNFPRDKGGRNVKLTTLPPSV
jgi:hypothetical protein